MTTYNKINTMVILGQIHVYLQQQPKLLTKFKLTQNDILNPSKLTNVFKLLIDHNCFGQKQPTFQLIIEGQEVAGNTQKFQGIVNQALTNFNPKPLTKPANQASSQLIQTEQRITELNQSLQDLQAQLTSVDSLISNYQGQLRQIHLQKTQSANNNNLQAIEQKIANLQKLGQVITSLSQVKTYEACIEVSVQLNDIKLSAPYKSILDSVKEQAKILKNLYANLNNVEAQITNWDTFHDNLYHAQYSIKTFVNFLTQYNIFQQCYDGFSSNPDAAANSNIVKQLKQAFMGVVMAELLQPFLILLDPNVNKKQYMQGVCQYILTFNFVDFNQLLESKDVDLSQSASHKHYPIALLLSLVLENFIQKLKPKKNLFGSASASFKAKALQTTSSTFIETANRTLVSRASSRQSQLSTIELNTTIKAELAILQTIFKNGTDFNLRDNNSAINFLQIINANIAFIRKPVMVVPAVGKTMRPNSVLSAIQKFQSNVDGLFLSIFDQTLPVGNKSHTLNENIKDIKSLLQSVLTGLAEYKVNQPQPSRFFQQGRASKLRTIG